MGPTWYAVHECKPLMGSRSQLQQQVGGPYRAKGAGASGWACCACGAVRPSAAVQSYVRKSWAGRFLSTCAGTSPRASTARCLRGTQSVPRATFATSPRPPAARDAWRAPHPGERSTRRGDRARHAGESARSQADPAEPARRRHRCPAGRLRNRVQIITINRSFVTGFAGESDRSSGATILAMARLLSMRIIAAWNARGVPTSTRG